MKLATAIRSNTAHFRSLLYAAISGTHSAQDSALAAEMMGSRMARFTMNTLGWAVMGTCAGVAGARIRSQQQPESSSAMSDALLGVAFGLSTGSLWNSRSLTQAAVREAKKNVEAVRDANWLSRKSINFG
jgi:hypothetical protein